MEREGEGIGAVDGTLIQSLGSLVDPRLDELEFKGGTVGFEGEMLGRKEWKLHLRGEELACEIQRAALQCQNAHVDWTSEKTGIFQFKGASAKALLGDDKRIFAEEWQGEGAIEQGVLIRSHFEGKVEKVPGSVAIEGTFEKFAFGAQGENFEAVLKCAWKREARFRHRGREIGRGSFWRGGMGGARGIFGACRPF